MATAHVNAPNMTSPQAAPADPEPANPEPANTPSATPKGLWYRHYGMPAPTVWPVAEAFVVSLTVSASLTASGTSHPHLGLIVLTVVVAVCAWGATAWQVPAIAAVAWPFDNGFMTGHLGDLHWRGEADVRALALLLACAATAAVIGHRFHRSERRGPSSTPDGPTGIDEPTPDRRHPAWLTW